MRGLRFFEGKQLVSQLRDNDYAHAGEKAAIDLCLQPLLPLTKPLTLLDVGCGLGLTADVMQKMGFTVTGCDIETEAVAYANEHYAPSFFTSEAATLDTSTQDKFDAFTLYNSFYAFREQEKALQAMANIANPGATLILFDYSDLTGNEKQNPLYRPACDEHEPLYPINPDTIANMLQASGWTPIKTVDVSIEYSQWYTTLLQNLLAQQDTIVEQFGDEGFAKALNRYSNLLEQLYLHNLGGAIVYATTTGSQ